MNVSMCMYIYDFDFQLLEATVVEHEKSFEEVCYYANQLAAGDHMRSGDLLLAKVVELQGQWNELNSVAEKRQNVLQQALQAQEVVTVSLYDVQCLQQ